MTIALLVALPGVLLVAGGVYLGSVGGTILASLGAILLNVALLSVLYDAFLKDILLDDVYAAMGLGEQVRSLDIESITRNDDADVNTVIQDATSLTVLPLDPETWLTGDWPKIRDLAASGSVKVTLLLPSHDGAHIAPLATRLRKSEDSLAKALGGLPDSVGASWDDASCSAHGSRLQVLLYEMVPAVGIVATDRGVLIEVPPPFGFPVASRRALVVSAGRKGASPMLTDLIDDGLREERIPGFSRSVSRPLPASVGPDPQIPPESASSPQSERDG